MIEKIVEIKNVGAFDDYHAHGNLQLRKLTLVAGGNSDGKTTLVAILRSLRDQSAAVLTERKTVGSTGAQHVHMRVDGQDVRFNGTSWTHPCSLIEVFDEDFIARNVHGEDGVEIDHRRGMYSVIIGEQGVTLKNSLVQLTEQIRQLGASINAAGTQLTPHMCGIPSTEFRHLAVVPEVDARIAEREKELSSIDQREQVLVAPLFENLTVPALEVATIEATLQATLQGLSTAAAAEVTGRISRRLGAQGQSWIATGIHFGMDPDCPFCGLSTAGNQLLLDYQGFFSKGYHQLRTSIQELLDQLVSQVGPGPMARVSATVARNAERLAFWSRVLTIALGPPDLTETEGAVSAIADRLATLLRQKTAAPLEPISLSASDREMIDRFTRAMTALNTYNSDVLSANSQIHQMRAGLAAANGDAIRSSLARLRAAKSRHSSTVAAQCDALAKLELDKTTAEDAKVLARRAIDNYAAGIIQRYQVKINQYLSDFKASFRLSGLVENYAGGQPGCQYGIEVRQVSVPLASGGAGVRFSTVLSGGDKRSLALALFFARLDESPNIADTRIVLDDPMCSLDRSRRFMTARRIVRLALNAKQVILLSHEPQFLRSVWDESRSTDVASDTTTLQVSRPSESASVIAWGIEEDTKSDYFKQLTKLEVYASGGAGDPLDVKRTLRPLLETWLRHERPRAFKATEWLGDMIAAIRIAPIGSRLDTLKPKLPDLTDINAFTRDDHHGTNPGSGPDPVDARELRGFVDRTLALVGWT